MNKNDITYLAGIQEIKVKPLLPFAPLVCNFLETLSAEIRKDTAFRIYPDIVSFAFWIRKANLQKQKTEFMPKIPAIGRGLAFHIAPSNVPVNFAYSFVFGLLSGNSNIVRVSSKKFEQVTLLCRTIQAVMERPEFTEIRESNAIISYERDKEITEYFSSFCDIRVIWGGDRTIHEMKGLHTKPRCKDIVFADRYSFGILNTDTVLAMTEQEMKVLAQHFYNDTYLMDQNACSAPHLLLWKSEDEEKTKKAQMYFWKHVVKAAEQYDLADIKVSEKYTDLCLSIVRESGIQNIEQYENLLYVITLDKLPKEMTNLRGRFGMFYQCRIRSLCEIKDQITEKVQTVATAGIDKEDITNFILENHLPGIDRVVSFGKTLDIGLVWDGYCLIDEMTRYIG